VNTEPNCLVILLSHFVDPQRRSAIVLPEIYEEIVLRQRATFSRGYLTNRGFSMVEMVVSVAVLLVLAAISLPSLTRAFASYQLSDAAARLAGTLKYTRYEAIRLNKPVDGQIQQTAAGWLVYADINRNQVPDLGETQDAITGQVTLLPASGLPDPAPIVAALGSSGLALTTISGANAVVTFDQRGAVTSGGGSNVYALYLGRGANSDSGYRAVVLLPSGMVHVWAAPSGGVWRQVN
jgi:prepilin-type N-terminal cleavage/methylation domain-containing protein